MRIVHFAPFAPNGCGLYEAARDMMVADLRAGHDVHLVDSGPVVGGEHRQGVPGQIDERGGTIVKSEEPRIAYHADIIVAHAGYIDSFIVQTQAPLIWVLHGRPGACFRPEQFGSGNSYSALVTIMDWPRVRKALTFWPYHAEFWKPAIQDGKLAVFDAPPIDETRFSADGPRHDFGELGGRWNIVLADSWREDVDLYEIATGALAFAREHRDVKFHFYGMEIPLRCWEYMLTEFRRFGALGEVWARRPNMEEIYRAADIVLSPHRITTRVIGEALSCGTPIIAAHGCKHATWRTDPADPLETKLLLEIAIENLIVVPENIRDVVRENAAELTLTRYSDRIDPLYQSLM